MNFPYQLSVPATYMRGGTSKGVFFVLSDLPKRCQVPGRARDAFLLRVIGSPDPYEKQIDGMGGGSSSTSKVVIVSKSDKPDHDVNYLFGQVAIDKPFVDWSGNCGNLSAAVGAFALHKQLIETEKIPDSGYAKIRIWQQNIGKTIEAEIPVQGGTVQELGDFELDGVTFPAAEIKVAFLDPAEGDGPMFPTGNVSDTLSVPGLGEFDVTMISSGIPTVFFRADQLGLKGTELQEDINTNPSRLEQFERLRAHAALRMGLIHSLEEAKSRQHTPKIAFVAPPATYVSSSGKTVRGDTIDLLVRALSMGKLHHAMMGTAAVAIATAAAIPGTVVNHAAGGRARKEVCFGHPSGTLTVGAEAILEDGQWRVRKAVMSRSARRLMDGCVFVPSDAF